MKAQALGPSTLQGTAMLRFQGSSSTPAAVDEPLGAVSLCSGLQALPQALLPASQSQNTPDTSKEHFSHGSVSTSHSSVREQ